MTVDELWDALRQVCCATKPPTAAKTIVMLRRDDLVNAMKLCARSPMAEAAASKPV